MKSNFKSYLKENNFPKWFIVVNMLPLLSILIWPFVALVSIFLMDNPKNFLETFITIILLDAYPLYLIAITYLSFKIYHKNRFLSIFLASLPIIFFIYLFLFQIADKIG